MDLNKLKELVESCPDLAQVPAEVTAGDVKKMFKIIEVLSEGLWKVRQADAGEFIKWQDEQEEKGNDLGDWDWFSQMAKDALNKAYEYLK